MHQMQLEQFISAQITENPDNKISGAYALCDELIGTPMYAAPLIGYADALDPLFAEIARHEKFVGLYQKPAWWLKNARTVISIFLPFTTTVKKSNIGGATPSKLWLHSRIEGQHLINAATKSICDFLINAGQQAVAPCLDNRFISLSSPKKQTPLAAQYPHLSFTSNWSERHAAYVAGLGTFSLSKGLITKRGIAGRFTSIITDLKITATIRDYNSIDEYCIRCGACIRKCPVQAISFEKGKEHTICADFLDKMSETFKPRYGCGKCQIAVPCESCRPM